MPDHLPEPSYTGFEPAAEQLVRAYTHQFAQHLISEARVLSIKAAGASAVRSQAQVQAVHVEDAWLATRSEKRRWLKRLKELMVFLGGAFFSVLVQSLLTISTIPVLQVIMGVVGLTLVLVALQLDP